MPSNMVAKKVAKVSVKFSVSKHRNIKTLMDHPPLLRQCTHDPGVFSNSSPFTLISTVEQTSMQSMLNSPAGNRLLAR